MVGLTGEVGRDVIVDAVLLERRVAQVAPQHGEHAHLVRSGEGLADLVQLARRLLGSEVDRRADTGGAQVVGLLDRAEHHLVELVRVGEQLVVVELDDERDAVRVAARHHAEHTERRGNGVAAAGDCQLDDVLRVEVARVGSERRGSGVLDALIDGKNRHVAAAAEAPARQQRLQVAQYLR